MIAAALMIFAFVALLAAIAVSRTPDERRDELSDELP